MFKILLIIASLQYMIYQTVSFPQDEFSDFLFPDDAPELPLDICQLPSNLGFTGKFLCYLIKKE
jgi:hypothetical protein